MLNNSSHNYDQIDYSKKDLNDYSYNNFQYENSYLNGVLFVVDIDPKTKTISDSNLELLFKILLGFSLTHYGENHVCENIISDCLEKHPFIKLLITNYTRKNESKLVTNI